MDSINSAINQNLSILSNWVDSTPVPQVIDTMTYDIYESSNPFRQKFSKNIDNKTNLLLQADMIDSQCYIFLGEYISASKILSKYTQIFVILK